MVVDSARPWNIKVTQDVQKETNIRGEKLINEYCVMKTLGKGSFGQVYLCERRLEDKPRKEFAMKILSKAKLLKIKKYIQCGDGMKIHTQLDNVQHEIDIMRNLYHKNVVIMFELIESKDDLYFILEYMSKGPCLTYDAQTQSFKSPILTNTRILTEEWAKKHLRDVVEGIVYLHSNRIVHRDIKPSNILVNEANQCHISDFGCALQFPSGQNHECQNTIGTFEFIAPECCTGKPYDPFKVDVWAIGVTLYIMLLGELPFHADTPQLLFQKICSEPLQIPHDTTLSSEATELLLLILDKNPNTRLTPQQILDHPWVTEEPPCF